MTCAACESSKERPMSGAYQLTCLHCCARLVLSTQPDRLQASVMLAAIARQPGDPDRADILALVRAMKTAR